MGKLADEMGDTWRRAKAAKLDNATAWATVVNRTLLPTIRAELAAISSDPTPAQGGPVLDAAAVEVDEFAASVGLRSGLLRILLETSYPEVLRLWGKRGNAA